jgi:hypothetical protein
MLFMIVNNFQIKFLDKEAMVKLGSSAGVGAGVDLKEKEEVQGGQATTSSAFTQSLFKYFPSYLPSRDQ